MKRPILIIISALLLIVGLVLFTHRGNEPVPSSELRHSSPQRDRARTISDRDDSRNLIPAKFLSLQSPPPSLAPELLPSNAKFKCLGGSGTGKVVDESGRILMESDKEISILKASVSADQSCVLVDGGDSANYLLWPASGKKIKLPAKPPGDNMLGFSWAWIGNGHLLGISGSQYPRKSKQDDDNAEKSKLYLLDIQSMDLSELKTPNDVSHPLLDVSETRPDGYVHLVQSEQHRYSEEDLGWFKVEIEH